MNAEVSISADLLEDPALISLSRARLWLARRARVRTPLGAAEYLGVVANHEAETYDKRVLVALDCLELYREFFPAEYARSTEPAFSVGREHEFYRLVDERLFPVIPTHGQTLAERLREEPNLFLPYVPVHGVQRHTWAPGSIDFHQLQTPFKLGQALVPMTESLACGRGWAALKWHFGLSGIPAPLESAGGGVGWSLFVYSCKLEETPLRHLPLVFHMMGYKTGIDWLDIPSVGFFGYEWSREDLTRLHLSWLKAQRMGEQVAELGSWLDEDPQGRIARAVELWNKAITVEVETGFAGMRTPDGVLGRCTLDGDVMRRVYGDGPLPMPADIDVQAAMLRPGTPAFHDLHAAAELAALLED